jgi:hypothetical protein
MGRLRTFFVALCLVLTASGAAAHDEADAIRIFGYFQNSFQHWTTFEDRREQNSFSVQQLNLLLQKNLGRDWTAYIISDGGEIEDEVIHVPNFGAAFQLNDQLRFKAQFARVRADEEHRVPGLEGVRRERDNFSIFSLAVSTFF